MDSTLRERVPENLPMISVGQLHRLLSKSNVKHLIIVSQKPGLNVSTAWVSHAIDKQPTQRERERE